MLAALLTATACGGTASATSSTSTAAGSSTTPVRASTTNPEARQTLTASRIRSEIGQRHVDVQACYNAALVRNPSHRGSVLVFFEIGPDGRVLRSNVLEDSSGDSLAAACLLAVVTGITFPPTGLGLMETRYSFDFREVDRDGDGID